MDKKILYVEDHPQNMRLIGRIVQALGYTFLEATDGESGWKMTLDHQPDLILMDLHLPGNYSGFELTRRIKQHDELKDIPVVALTALKDVELDALQAGCDGFLRKPADIRQIRATLQRHLETEGTPSEQPQAAIQQRASQGYTFI